MFGKIKTTRRRKWQPGGANLLAIILQKNPNRPFPSLWERLWAVIRLLATHLPYGSALIKASSPACVDLGMPKGEARLRTDGTDVRETRSSCFFPARGLRLSKWSPPHLPADPPPLLLLPPGQLAEKPKQLSRAGKVGLCSAGLPFKGLFGHKGPGYSCRLRCQGEELMVCSASSQTGFSVPCIFYTCT